MDGPEITFTKLFEKRRIKALEDRVVIEIKSPVQEFQVEYEYSELKPRIARGRSGDPGWTNLGYLLIVGLVLFTFGISFIFPNVLRNPFLRLLPLSIVILALIAFSLRLIKYDCVWFVDTDGDYAFMIKLTKENRGTSEQVIDYILKQITDINRKQP